MAPARQTQIRSTGRACLFDTLLLHFPFTFLLVKLTHISRCAALVACSRLNRCALLYRHAPTGSFFEIKKIKKKPLVSCLTDELGLKSVRSIHASLLPQPALGQGGFHRLQLGVALLHLQRQRGSVYMGLRQLSCQSLPRFVSEFQLPDQPR